MRPNSKPVRLFAEKHLENIKSMMDSLYNDELLTDVTLCCKTGSIRAHKLILASNSPYFRKVFVENSREHTVFIMHGIEFGQLKNLIELIYKGSVDIPGEALNSVYDLAEELDVSGVLVDDSSNENGTHGPSNGYGRDTRFKGQKRVAVDYREIVESMGTPSKNNRNCERRPSTSEKSPQRKITSEKSENIANDSFERDLNQSDPTAASTPRKDPGKLVSENLANSSVTSTEETGNKSSNLWAKKLRKFKCELCPSSFKRASHLTRHQLVHTGERPYACDQCDKAFSRHDKLKHHIRKSHELTGTMEMGSMEMGSVEMSGDLPSDSLYTIGHVRILTPEPMVTLENSSQSLPKKGRGRPRKYPPDDVTVPPPLVKRPRGRPRLNPVVLPSQMLRRENYDITNLPFGDIEYLTKPLHDDCSVEMEEAAMMEPLVEIKMETSLEIKTEQIEKPEGDPAKCPSAFFDGIGLFENSIAKIGECTISVANHSSE